MAKNHNVHEIRQTKHDLKRYEEGQGTMNWVYDNPALFATLAGINLLAAKAKRAKTVYPSSNAEANVVYDNVEKLMRKGGASKWEISQVKRGLSYGDMKDVFIHLATRGAIPGAKADGSEITIKRPDGDVVVRKDPHKKKINLGKVGTVIGTATGLGLAGGLYYAEKSGMIDIDGDKDGGTAETKEIKTFDIESNYHMEGVANHYLNESERQAIGILQKYINFDSSDDEVKNGTVAVDFGQKPDSKKETSFVNTFLEDGTPISKNITRAAAEKIANATSKAPKQANIKAFDIETKPLMGAIVYGYLSSDERNVTGMIDAYFDDNTTNKEFKKAVVGVDFNASANDSKPTSFIKAELNDGSVVQKNISRALAEKLVDGKSKVLGSPIEYEGKGTCVPSKIAKETNLSKMEEYLRSCSDFPQIKINHDDSGGVLLAYLHNTYEAMLNRSPVADLVDRWNKSNQSSPDYIVNVTLIDTPDDAPGAPIGGGSIMIVREQDGDTDRIVLSKEETRIWRETLKVGG